MAEKITGRKEIKKKKMMLSKERIKSVSKKNLYQMFHIDFTSKKVS